MSDTVSGLLTVAVFGFSAVGVVGLVALMALIALQGVLPSGGARRCTSTRPSTPPSPSSPTPTGSRMPVSRVSRAVWGPSYGRESNYLRVYANQLRRNLEPDPAEPRHLLTEPGLGYRFVP